LSYCFAEDSSVIRKWWPSGTTWLCRKRCNSVKCGPELILRVVTGAWNCTSSYDWASR